MKSPLGVLFLFGAVLVLVTAACLPERKTGEEEGEVKRELGESHLLKKKEENRPVGYTSVFTMKVSAPALDTTLKVGPNEVKGRTKRTGGMRTVVQVLGRDRYRVTSQVETFTEEFVAENGMRGTDTQKGALVGKYVLVEKIEGKWGARFESGDEPTEEEAEALEKWAQAFREDEAEAKDEVRRVGEEWEEDVDVLGEGSMTLLFDRVEEYQGQPCAVLVGTIRTENEAGDGGSSVLEGKVRTYWSLTHREELYSEISGNLAVVAFPQLGAELRATGSVTVTGTTVVTVPEKK